jgi:outer membrane protein assembly factor BamB
MRTHLLRALILLCLLTLIGCTQQTSVPSGATPTPIVLITPAPSLTPQPPVPVPTAAPSAPPSVYLSLSDHSLAALNADNGQKRWRISFEPSYALVLVNNVLYVGTDLGVYALNASDGTFRWHTYYARAPITGLAVQDNIVYDAAADGSIAALNASDGASRWEYALGQPATSLATDGNRLYVSSFQGTLAGLELNGSLIWEDQISNVVFSRVVAANGSLYLIENVTNGPSPGAQLASFSQYGQPLWSVSPTGGQSLLAPPVLTSDGLIYTADAQNLYGFNAIKGTEIWQQQVMSTKAAPGLQSLAAVGNLILLGTSTTNTAGEAQGEVLAYSIGEGKQYWQTLLDKEGTSPSMICQALGTTLIVETTGRLYALDTNGGAILWQNAFNQMALPFFTVG